MGIKEQAVPSERTQAAVFTQLHTRSCRPPERRGRTAVPAPVGRCRAQRRDLPGPQRWLVPAGRRCCPLVYRAARRRLDRRGWRWGRGRLGRDLPASADIWECRGGAWAGEGHPSARAAPHRESLLRPSGPGRCSAGRAAFTAVGELPRPAPLLHNLPRTRWAGTGSPAVPAEPHASLGSSCGVPLPGSCSPFASWVGRNKKEDKRKIRAAAALPELPPQEPYSSGKEVL